MYYRLFLTASLLIAISVVYSIVSSDKKDKRLYRECLNPTCAIVLKKDPVGTGVVVRSTKIENGVYYNVALTCNHVMQLNPLCTIRIPYFHEEEGALFIDYKGILYSSCPSKDLAIVVFESEFPIATATLNFNKKVFLGMDIFKVACGMHEEWRLDFGKITSTKIAKETEDCLLSDMYRISAFTVFGDSGSPIFNDYECIALLQSVRSDGNIGILSQMAYAIPISNLKLWNEDVNNTIAFAWDNHKKLPVIPFMRCKVITEEFIESGLELTYWEKNYK